MTEKYRFEQLDRETRDYLVNAREQTGKGTPGVFVGKTNYLPIVGMIAGFLVLIVTVLITFPPTDPPVKEAMLQTAGLVFGGWLILAALRVWMSGKSGGYAGHFAYADPEYLYVARGSAVEITDLAELTEAKATHNYNEGKYQNSSITLRLGKSRRTIQVNNEERGRRLSMYLNAVAYMREGGEDGKDADLQSLPPETMGAVAKHVAITGEFPTNVARFEEGDSVRVPKPQRERGASTGIFGILLIGLLGTGIFYGLMTINYPFRDQAVFARIQSLPDKEKPPHLRLYLDNPHFTAHRDEAKQELTRLYEVMARDNIKGIDPEARRGLSEVVVGLKDKPVGALSLRAVEESTPVALEAGRILREKTVADKLADKWGITIGDEFVAFAVMEDPDIPVNVELRWKFTDTREVAYTLTFRHSPDEAAILTTSGFVLPILDVNRNLDIHKTIEAFTQQVITATVGEPKIRPILPVEEF